MEHTLFFHNALIQIANKRKRYHIPLHSTDIITLGIIVAVFSFFIGVFIDYSFFNTRQDDVPVLPVSPTIKPPPPQPTVSLTNRPMAHLAVITTDNEEQDDGDVITQGILVALVNESEQADTTDTEAPLIEPIDPRVAFSGQQYRVRRTMKVVVTAYSSTRDQTDSTPFITASNTQVRWGTVATNFLPFDTKITLPSMFGDKVFVVEDRMNKRYWHRVDVWMPTRQEAINFGIRTLQIEILEPIPPQQQA